MATPSIARADATVRRLPGVLLRLEGAAVAVGAVLLYAHGGYGWGWFALFALAPDLSFAAAAAGQRAGVVAYDLAHTTVGPVALGVVGVLADEQWPLRVALVWLVHIGVDLTLDYGLRYSLGRAEMGRRDFSAATPRT